ncbi:DddA-like double-stranded DNA deaminase toxin [Streptomyces sp. NPDC096132]|uniref:DddA-like double-stranded DNA deaminase toxin n=1 Tax=Streptomyces sp. NPDC096132 TaxID=3366075 RepID=UPI0038065266
MDGLSDHVTSAVPTDANGSVIGPEFRSGNDAAQRRANGMLQQATGRRAQWDAAAHAEPKVALWMNDNDVSFANIVINNSYVCGGAGGQGCVNVLPHILESGRSVNVWYRDLQRVLQNTGLIHGRAPRRSP